MKRFLSMLLSAALMLSIIAFASCGETPADPTTTASTTTAATTTADTTTAATTTAETTTAETTTAETTTADTTTASAASETTEASSADETTADTTPENPTIDLSGFDGYTKLPGYEDVDFGGKVFTIGLLGEGNETSFYTEETDSISVAVRERNALVEKLYNCKIEFNISTSPQQVVNADITGNIHTIDLYMTQYPSSAYYTNNQNYNLYNLGINFENPWWDQAYVSTYTFDKNGTKAMYGAIGDFARPSSIYSLFYNIDLYAQNQVCQQYDIYQLVRDKKWTMDIFVEMIKGVKQDTNGNSAYTYKDGDIMGWIRTQHASHAMHVASNMKIMNNVNGKLVFEPSTQSNEWSNVLEKAISVFTTEGAEDVSYADIPNYVASGKALFFSEILTTIEGMKDMDVSIGIVPYPLYSETQEQYCNYVDNHVADYHIPVSVLDPETVGTFFELLTCHSKYIVRTAIIDAYTVEYLGDEESSEMLDLIMSNITYDPGYLWWSPYESAISNMIASGKNSFTKWVGQKEKSAKTDIETVYNDILKNEN